MKCVALAKFLGYLEDFELFVCGGKLGNGSTRDILAPLDPHVRSKGHRKVQYRRKDEGLNAYRSYFVLNFQFVHLTDLDIAV